MNYNIQYVWNILHALTCLYAGGFLSSSGSSWQFVRSDTHCRQATVASLTAETTHNNNAHNGQWTLSKKSNPHANKKTA